MLLYYLFWMFNGLIYILLYYFWNQPINRRPSASFCFFFAYFRVSQKRNIKQSPNGMKPSGELFLERKQSRRLGVYIREATRKAQGRGCAHPLGAPPTLVGPSWLPLPTSFAYIYPYTLKPSGNRIDREFRRRKPL